MSTHIIKDVPITSDRKPILIKVTQPEAGRIVEIKINSMDELRYACDGLAATKIAIAMEFNGYDIEKIIKFFECTKYCFFAGNKHL